MKNYNPNKCCKSVTFCTDVQEQNFLFGPPSSLCKYISVRALATNQNTETKITIQTNVVNQSHSVLMYRNKIFFLAHHRLSVNISVSEHWQPIRTQRLQQRQPITELAAKAGGSQIREFPAGMLI